MKITKEDKLKELSEQAAKIYADTLLDDLIEIKELLKKLPKEFVNPTINLKTEYSYKSNAPEFKFNFDLKEDIGVVSYAEPMNDIIVMFKSNKDMKKLCPNHKETIALLNEIYEKALKIDEKWIFDRKDDDFLMVSQNAAVVNITAVVIGNKIQVSKGVIDEKVKRLGM